MSLELKIEELTVAVKQLTLLMSNTPMPVAAVQQIVPPIVAAQPAPVAPPIVQAPVAAPIAMPPPPVFTTPVAPSVPQGAPFSDGKGLIAYIMETYKALGPVKGAKIQDVMTGFGCKNINEVRPENYATLYAGVEALKAA